MAGKELNPGSQTLGMLLKAEDFTSGLADICDNIPGRVSNERIENLWREKRFEELMCLCLPTVSACFENYQNMYGIDREELLEASFVVLPDLIGSWSPGKILRNGHPDYLKAYISRNLKRAVEVMIVRQFGLAGVDDLPLVQLYSRSWGQFIMRNRRQPELSEISEIVESKNGGRHELTIGFGESKINKIKVMYEATQLEPEEKAWFVADETLTPEQAVVLESLKKSIRGLVEGLTSDEQRVLSLIYGLQEDSQELTLEEVGKKFGVTREKIRQIEAKALRKLRHPQRCRQLRDYLV